MVLGDFERAMWKHNPATLTEDDGYELEALSALARFHEAALQQVPATDAARGAVEVVQATFSFWFGSELTEEAAEGLGADLLATYLASFQEAEQAGDPGIGSVT